MNQNLQIFKYNNEEVRMIMHDGNPWWVLKDVCDVLGLSNPTVVADRLDDDERAKFDLGRSGTTGGGGETNIINESGLYNVILKSDKPEAKNFKRWITHEVLPSIRKHGGYLTPAKIEEALFNPDVLIRLATDLKAEREKRASVEAVKDRQIQLLETKIAEDAPRVAFADAFTFAEGSITIAELAKILCQNGFKIGETRLKTWFRKNGWFIRQVGPNYNTPTQKAMERGLFRITGNLDQLPCGHTFLRPDVRVTTRGQRFFIDEFLKTRTENLCLIGSNMKTDCAQSNSVFIKSHMATKTIQ